MIHVNPADCPLTDRELADLDDALSAVAGDDPTALALLCAVSEVRAARASGRAQAPAPLAEPGFFARLAQRLAAPFAAPAAMDPESAYESRGVISL